MLQGEVVLMRRYRCPLFPTFNPRHKLRVRRHFTVLITSGINKHERRGRLVVSVAVVIAANKKRYSYLHQGLSCLLKFSMRALNRVRPTFSRLCLSDPWLVLWAGLNGNWMERIPGPKLTVGGITLICGPMEQENPDSLGSSNIVEWRRW
ncbi:hypothetical protein J6590_033721 [Homalodisca vitripennis]|nr:hypothetical protein J6590_033721 [Homalodisca vitripennis]